MRAWISGPAVGRVIAVALAVAAFWLPANAGAQPPAGSRSEDERERLERVLRLLEEVVEDRSRAEVAKAVARDFFHERRAAELISENKALAMRLLGLKHETSREELRRRAEELGRHVQESVRRSVDLWFQLKNTLAPEEWNRFTSRLADWWAPLGGLLVPGA